MFRVATQTEVRGIFWFQQQLIPSRPFSLYGSWAIIMLYERTMISYDHKYSLHQFGWQHEMFCGQCLYLQERHHVRVGQLLKHLNSPLYWRFFTFYGLCQRSCGLITVILEYVYYFGRLPRVRRPLPTLLRCYRWQ